MSSFVVSQVYASDISIKDQNNMLVRSLSVPYFIQNEKDSCGAAVLAMVYTYFSFQITEEELWERCKTQRSLEEGFHIRTAHLAKDARKNSFRVIHGQFLLEEESKIKNNLLTLIESNIPVIACVQYEGTKFGHFIVIIGINESQIIYHDPEEGKKRKIKFKKFLKNWHPKDGGEVIGGEFLLVFPKEAKFSSRKLKAYTEFDY